MGSVTELAQWVSHASQGSAQRILVIDDNPAIHEDFRKVLCPAAGTSEALEAASAAFLGRKVTKAPLPKYELDSELSGEAGLARMTDAMAQGRPYSLAFVDMRMPNGWNGLETIQRLWEICPGLQVVLCTAFSDFSWEEMRDYLGRSDRFLILKKPFDNIEVQQLADALTHRYETEAQLRLLQAGVALINDVVLITDAGAPGVAPRIIYVNEAFERFTGYRAAEAIGKSPKMLQGPRTDRAELDRIRDAIDRGQPVRAELINYTREGKEYWLDLDIVPMRTVGGKVAHFVAVQRDITSQKEANAYVEHLAYYDSLTGLPNRRLFADRLSQLAAACARKPAWCAMLMVDLDGFKQINDTYGHELGDLLLIEVATRLRHCVREQDTLARMGGDEFMLLLKDVGTSEDNARINCERIAEKVAKLLDGGYLLFGNEYRFTASIGITVFGHSPARSEVLLKQADIAMVRAKAAGKNTFAFHEEDLQAMVDERVRMGQDLRSALLARQLSLHLQPQIDVAHGLVGAEALLRWERPGRGPVPAALFMGLAETTGLIEGLDAWAMEAACKELASWAGTPSMVGLKLALNVSRQQFHAPDFVDGLLACLRAAGARADRLVLELTESVLVDDLDEVADKVSRLRAAGVGVALDDFGIGHASLAYLRRLALTELKIDQTFVRDLLSDASSATVARTVVALGQSLGVDVRAEGVETQAQKAYLLDLGCRSFQGFLFSKPLPSDEFRLFAQAQAFLASTLV
jgi:diguanylate cyclase (GGDEF)-like protein/PAS domain S-box-containing protein